MPDNLISYEYNANGEMLSALSKNSKVMYTRDTKDRVLSAQVIGLNEMANYPENKFWYSYDGNDNLTNINSNLGSQILSYDELNRLTQLQTSSGSVFNFTFDEINRLTKITRPGSQTDFSYTSGGTVEQIIHSSGGVTKAFAQYSYDLRNLPTQKRNVAGTLDYSYDLDGQLTGVSSSDESSSELFTYDSIGNRLTDKDGNYIYDETSQIIKEDYQYFYNHDNNGNLITKIAKDQSKDSFSYTYTSMNQLSSIRVYQSLAAPIKKQVNYQYDVLGRRLQKEVIDNVDSTKSVTRKYMYNGDNIFAEFDGSNNVLAKYVHSHFSADDLLEVEVTSYGVQSGLARAAGKYQYLKDILGTVTDLMDSNGNIVQRYDYTAYGKIRSIKDGDGNDVSEMPNVNTSFAFTGREYDSEIGLYYYRARYYDANIGRFLQQDSDPGKLNIPSTFLSKYIYGINNPVVFSDPSGMSILSGVIDAFLQAGHDFIANFGAGFDNFIKDKTVQTILVLAAAAFGAYLFAPAIAGAFGFTSGYGAMIASTLWGAALGGIIGGLGYTALGIGSFKDGFRAGAIVGSIAGGFNYGYHAVAKFSTSSPDLAVRTLGYLSNIVGIAQPLHFIPIAWSCDDLSVETGTSGLFGSCHD